MARVKLDWPAVYSIRRRWAAGDITQRALAAEYGVDQKAISNVVRGRSWPDDSYQPPAPRRGCRSKARQLDPGELAQLLAAVGAS
jgi:Helix-turn-helix